MLCDGAGPLWQQANTCRTIVLQVFLFNDLGSLGY
jgi:hypothetical protein